MIAHTSIRQKKIEKASEGMCVGACVYGYMEIAPLLRHLLIANNLAFLLEKID